MHLISNVQIKVHRRVYLKDPDTSVLGQKIVAGAVDMIDELGFEHFTFRKLARSINSTEASIYRYFESKHQLLLYLTAWYWSWMEYNIVLGTANIEDPRVRLIRAIAILTSAVIPDSDSTPINESKLHHIVLCDSSKSYLTKEVDQENAEGVFTGYKIVVNKVSDIILEISPDYRYPHMLVSTVIEGCHHQRFFAEHLTSLTDVHKGEDAISNFYRDIVFKAIESC